MSVEHIEYVSPVTGATTDTPTLIEGTATVGGDTVVLIADMTVQELLGQILIELKKINIRDEAVTGEQVNDGDIQCK